MDIFDGADVQAPGRLYRDEDLRIQVDLPGSDSLLLVSSRHAAHDGPGAPAASDIKFFDELVGVPVSRVEPQKTVLLELRSEIFLQDQVLG